MATITRPAAGYTPTNPITNTTKYQNDSAATSPRVAISSLKVDGDINKAFDVLTNHDNDLVKFTAPVANLSAVTVATADHVVFADASNSNALARTTVQGILDLVTTNPTGAIISFAGSSAPTGWLLCGGQAVSRTTYAALFGVISTTYGAGDGSTTFNLPDLRGRAVFGVDNMGGSTASRITAGVSGITGTTLGAVGGSESMQSHTHTANVTDPGHAHSIQLIAQGTTAGNNIPQTTSTPNGGVASTNSATTGISVTNTSTGAGNSQNVPPAIMLNYIIKT